MDIKVIAVIPARGGSKGVKQKNIRDVCGKPLIYYQIRNSLDAKLVDRTILATDDPVIADTGRDLFGDRIEIVMRPAEISHEMSKTEETLIYVLEQLGEDNIENIIVTLEPTNPLNRPEYIDSCIKLVLGGEYDSSCCVVEDYGFFVDTSEDVSRVIERPMRRYLKPRLKERGNCWVTRVGTLQKENNRLGGKVGFFKIPEYDGCHLDSEDDWRIIESLLRQRIYTDKDRYYKIRVSDIAKDAYEEEYWGIVTDPDGLVRDRTQEREKRIRECGEEINYINRFKPGRVLDVGCGLGFLLSGINDEWEKYGVEISSFAAERAGTYGSIFCGTLQEAEYESDFFDAVILYHVIEHMKDPVEELSEVRRILKPYGKLIVSTPDFDCGLANRFGDNFRLLHDTTHISLFNTLSLNRMLTDLWFEVESMSCPYFDTEHFTRDNLMRLFDTSKISPPFYGNIVTFYAYKK